MSRLETTRKNIPQPFYCSITQEIMQDPVICADGHSYERAAISRWFERNNTSPVTNLPLPNKILIPNFALKSTIEEFFLSEKISDKKSTPQAVKRSLTTSFRQSSEGDSPIHCAIRNNNVAMLDRLLNNDNLKLKNGNGKTAIELAAYLGRWDLVIRIAKAYKPKRNDPKDDIICAAYDKVLGIAARECKEADFTALQHALKIREQKPLKKPSIATLKKTYKSNVTFFSFQIGSIFEGNDVDKVIQRLKDRGNGGASEKTLEAFKLR